MGLYQEVYRRLTPEEERERKAADLRKRWANPGEPTLITECEAVPRVKSSQPNRQGSREKLAARRAQAAAMYARLRAEGVMRAEAKKQVAAAFNAAVRTIADWVKGE